MKRSAVKKILLIAAVICVLLAVGILVWHGYSSKKEQEKMDALRQGAETTSTQTDTQAAQTTSESVSETLDIPVDFAYWQGINSDVYAWLSYPGLEIEQPIVQSADDNTLYLRHDIEKEYAEGGTVYTENYNSKDFTDFLTVVYGHNLTDGTMFAPLHKLEDQAEFDKDREILVYTPDAIYHYQVWAAVYHSDEHLLLNYDYSSAETRLSFLNAVRNTRDMASHYDDTVDVSTEDKLLVLSTCGPTSANRYLVIAVLSNIETDETH